MKPKDEKFTAPRYSPSNRSVESPEEIKARINRLSQTLSNTVTLSRFFSLPLPSAFVVINYICD